MQHWILKRVAPLVLVVSGLGVIPLVGATAATAQTEHAMAPIKAVGHITKIASMSSFTMLAGKTHYVVKTDDMTKIEVGTKKVTFHTLKVGDDVTVKGPDEMGTITATSVVVSTMSSAM